MRKIYAAESVIGFRLVFAALRQMANANFLVSFITLMVTILLPVYLQNKGFIGMLPILLGGIIGYIVSAVLDPGLVSGAGIAAAPFIQLPHITLPTFSGELAATAIVSISITAIVTIPDSTAHLYQMSLYIDRFAEDVIAILLGFIGKLEAVVASVPQCLAS